MQRLYHCCNMVELWMKVCLKCLIIYATIISLTSALTLPHQVTVKPKVKTNSSNLAPVSTRTSETDDSGIALYRYINSNSGSTCILLKTDALVEVNFTAHGIKERADSFIPEKALVDGNCKSEDISELRISWAGYSVVLNFAKTPGGERWYISEVEVTVSPDLPQTKDIPTGGKPIKLYNREMLMPTPIGRSYACEEVDIDLVTDEVDQMPAGLRGQLLLRLIRLQPFMFKADNFETAFDCKSQQSFRDETAPLAVGLSLAFVVLMTITGYAVFRYFKIQNVQYNTMKD